MTIRLKALSNCSNVFLVWQTTEKIPECRGFAIHRKIDGVEGVLKSSVGFSDDPHPIPGNFHTTAEWPLQRFTWTDFGARVGTQLQYKVVPMVGKEGDLQPDEHNASLWTEPFSLDTENNEDISAYFNDGVLGTQWLSRTLHIDDYPSQRGLRQAMDTPDDPIRKRLGGAILDKLIALLDNAIESNAIVYAALFELKDAELIDKIVQLGKRAKIVLANGAGKGDDENADARAILEQHHVEVHDRMLKTGHLGHNKFMVICSPSGVPQKVWTGSTNWQTTGLCSQANNAILIDNAQVAAFYLQQWKLLAKAGDEFPPVPKDETLRKVFELQNRTATISFTPWEGHVGILTDEEPLDLAYAKMLIDQAKYGILFLMFNPGPIGTLIDPIKAHNTKSNKLYIRGVLNQDPSTTKNPVVGLFHGKESIPASFDTVLPEAIDTRISYWLPEIRQLAGTHAIVHSKVVVIDPFGDHPVVITGSHNLGAKASTANDENLVIIEKDWNLARQYAVNIITVFNQYWWRYNRMPAKHRTAAADHEYGEVLTDSQPQSIWKGLRDSDSWQDQYFKDASRRHELAFWLGDDARLYARPEGERECVPLRVPARKRRSP
jgi:hypothetical protein